MTDDIIQRIKKIAHEVSEGFLLFGNDMDEAILQKFNDGEIDNVEMLKRVCEHSNQNVYLAKFNDGESRKNISFPVADFNSIRKNIDESERSMELYETPPEDFRSALEMVIDNAVKEQEQEKDAEIKLGKDDAYAATEYRNQFARLANTVGMMKTASIEEFESGFNLIYHDAKRIVANGESLGDMAKVATRFVMEEGLNPKGVMKAYGIIEKELVDSGFSVNTGFTKLSSLKINHSSIALRPVRKMSLAIEKIAALEEMEGRLNTVVTAFDRVIKKNVE